MTTVGAGVQGAELLSLVESSGGSPVLIEEGARKAVVLSVERYRLLEAQAEQRFLQAWDEVSRQAEKNGMTEQDLADILSDFEQEHR